MTSEPGLYGLGCATFTQRARVVETEVQQYLRPFLIGKDPAAIEDIYNDYRRVAQYFFIDYGGRVDFGVNLGSNSQLRAGYWADRRRVEVDTGSSLLPTGNNTDAGLTASGFFDNRDA